MSISILHGAGPLRPKRVDRVLVIGPGPVLGELPARIDPAGLRRHDVQVPAIAVRCHLGEDAGALVGVYGTE